MRALNVTKAAALAFAVAFAAGCSTTGTGTGAGEGTDQSGATTSSTDRGSVTGGSVSDVANLRTVFYFDFDKSVVKAEGFADLEGHARYLAANPTAKVRLDGHADERGTREYNMALGERRGNAVARFLVVNGVSSSQIEVISYGEEKPAMIGHNEGSWAKNRRVELSYESR